MLRPPPVPRWLRELAWLFMAWFAVLLAYHRYPAVSPGSAKPPPTGLECIGMGLLDLLLAVLSWENRPRFKLDG